MEYQAKLVARFVIARVTLASLVASGCAQEIELKDTGGERPRDPGDPYVSIVASVPSGTLNSTCVIGLDLIESTSGETAASVTVSASGRDWVGATLEGGVQYSAIGNWTDCTAGQGATGTFESSTFSGVAGDWFVFAYNGVRGEFETLKQTEDFEGAGAYFSVTDDGDAAALATTVAIDAKRDGERYYASWTGSRAVGDVLSALSALDGYSEGEPEWSDETPGWW